MDESKLDRQGALGVCSTVGHGLRLWSAAFADFPDGILVAPLALLVQFLKAFTKRRKSWEMRLAPM